MYRKCSCVFDRHQSSASWFYPKISGVTVSIQEWGGGTLSQASMLPVFHPSHCSSCCSSSLLVSCSDPHWDRRPCYLGPLELPFHYSKEKQIFTYLLQAFPFREALESMHFKLKEKAILFYLGTAPLSPGCSPNQKWWRQPMGVKKQNCIILSQNHYGHTDYMFCFWIQLIILNSFIWISSPSDQTLFTSALLSVGTLVPASFYPCASGWDHVHILGCLPRSLLSLQLTHQINTNIEKSDFTPQWHS